MVQRVSILVDLRLVLLENLLARALQLSLRHFCLECRHPRVHKGPVHDGLLAIAAKFPPTTLRLWQWYGNGGTQTKLLLHVVHET